MSKVPSGTEAVRPFLPTRDFDLSKRFYEALGFDKVLDGDVAIFEVGSCGFILQRHYKAEWAENCMLPRMAHRCVLVAEFVRIRWMPRPNSHEFGYGAQYGLQLMVDDLDAWWAHIVTLDLSARFGVPAPKAPVMQPWGLRVAYVIDPAGVLWHIAQRREGATQDG